MLVATLSTFYLTVLGIIIQSLKLIGQHAQINELKMQKQFFKIDILNSDIDLDCLPFLIFIHCVYPLRIMQPFLFLHEILFASLSAVPHVGSIFLKSPLKVFLMVIFGLLCFLLPGGFHLMPFLGILFCSILSTCHSHLCLLCLTSVTILQHLVLAYRSSFENQFCQYIANSS